MNIFNINIDAVNPSMILGDEGNKLQELRKDLLKILRTKLEVQDVIINIIEITNPDSDPRILANFVQQQLEKRVPFRKVMKVAIAKAQKANVKGIKIQVSGRLNGAEIARTEWIREGEVPLHTLRANIDYCNYKAR